LDENEKKAIEEFDQAEYSILGKFDESLIHEVPNDEMEEPIAGEEDADVSEEKDGDGKNDQVYGPDELHGTQLYLATTWR